MTFYAPTDYPVLFVGHPGPDAGPVLLGTPFGHGPIDRTAPRSFRDDGVPLSSRARDNADRRARQDLEASRRRQEAAGQRSARSRLQKQLAYDNSLLLHKQMTASPREKELRRLEFEQELARNKASHR